ncbi:M15 family metallopeptidase [Agromyces kandeliae]|uniref:D-alanyl-D-alanine carboxypeptidase family protein n=1 Tax=Agromyces kandeliae TaxID=2666141 RepID=A0A6L5QZ60_9MICO|nr:M15 family metallopeptidase [Agromyces kandeliae]MRX43096.1 D-alanyl-D-alanine carboxypeptidase family protein [Agromyces kandeliae]
MSSGTGPSPRVRRNRLIAALIGMVLVAALAVWAIVAFAPSADSAGASATPTPTPTATPRPAPTATSTPTPVDTFDKAAHSIDDPDSIWVVVDKLRPLNPTDYEPADLVVVPVPHTWEPLMRAEASDAVVKMFQAASAEAGLSLASNSAYRSYEAQERIYDNDDELTARPGFSEHQTGLTIDIGPESGNCSLAVCFADTPEGQWLRDNAYRFGFLLRYPADKVEVTGYQFEPWHFRYIGTDLSNEMHEKGVTTLEEFFGLPAAPDYA